MKYVKLPIPVDAWQIDAEAIEIPVWVQSAMDKGLFNTIPYPNVSTLEGLMTGNFGDYLIKGVMGEYYICAKSVFEKTYTEYVPEDEDCCGCGSCETPAKSININSIADHPDGSATVSLDMSYDNLLSFARIGIKKAILDAATEAVKLKPMECGFADEDVVCDNCTCWKSLDV